MDIIRALIGPTEGDTVPCEGGCGLIPLDQAKEDLSGGYLCPECAESSAVPCDMCGEVKPVRLYAEDGGYADEYLMPPRYIAVCEGCDNPQEAA